MMFMDNLFFSRIQYLIRVLQQYPSASATIKGSPAYPEISGQARFYQTEEGVIVLAQVFGLPMDDSPCEKGIFAFHIHSGGSCTGNNDDAFAGAKNHYNPSNCEHPNHSGDLLPLWGNNGYAFELFLTDRFSVDEIIGRTVIVHLNADDFTTQPAGNAGEKIACGIIKLNS